MSAEVPSRLGNPQVTTNRLGDALKWLKLGDCLILCTTGKKKQIFHQIYHRCVYKEEGAKKRTEDIPLDSLRVIYVAIPPSFLEKWQRVFQAAGNQTCACNIQKKITSINNHFPYEYQL